MRWPVVEQVFLQQDDGRGPTLPRTLPSTIEPGRWHGDITCEAAALARYLVAAGCRELGIGSNPTIVQFVTPTPPSGEGNRGRKLNMTVSRAKRIGAGAVLLGGGVLAGLGVGAGVAQADPYQPGGAPSRWCPGQQLPAPDVVWDMNVCHYYRTSYKPGEHGDLSQYVYSADEPTLGSLCGGAPFCLPGL